jgi:hypothetical protein
MSRLGRDLAKQAMEVLRGDPGQILRRDPLDLGKALDRVDDESRLVALAALGHRRQIGCVGFDQEPLERHRGGGLAKRFGLLEGNDTGERDVEAELERRLRKGVPGREAVNDASEGPFRIFLAQGA